MTIKRRVEKLEGRIPAGEAIILLDKIDGRLYWNGQETTEAKIRESHKAAVLIIDDIPDNFDFEQWKKDGRPPLHNSHES